MNKPSPDMWDALAESVGAERRTAYWRSVARIRQLRPDDEILILIEAMGVLALVTVETPKGLAVERAAWTEQWGRMRGELERLTREMGMHAVTTENAVSRAGSNLARTVSMVESGAATVREGLRTAPSKIDAEAIADAVARKVETQIVDPAVKAVQAAVAAVNKLPELASRAKEAMDFLKYYGLGLHYLTAVILGWAVAVLLPLLFKGGSH